MFSKTQDLTSFARELGANEVTIVPGPDTSNPREKAFVSFNDPNRTSAPLSTKANLEKPLVISWFVPEDGEPMWMVHNPGEGGRTPILKISVV
jgi:hypothetical protein